MLTATFKQIRCSTFIVVIIQPRYDLDTCFPILGGGQFRPEFSSSGQTCFQKFRCSTFIVVLMQPRCDLYIRFPILGGGQFRPVLLDKYGFPKFSMFNFYYRFNNKKEDTIWTLVFQSQAVSGQFRLDFLLLCKYGFFQNVLYHQVKLSKTKQKPSKTK